MGSTFAYLLRTVPGVTTMRESGHDRRPGVLKDNASSMHMALISVEKLRTGRFHLSTSLQTGMGVSLEAMKQKFIDQLHDYNLEIRIDPENHFVQPKYMWHGKTINDDLLIAIIMAPYWDEFFREAEGR